MGTYPIKIVLAGGVVGFIIIITAFKNIKGKLTNNDMHCKIKINLNSKSIYINAIIDTGNFLKEPITKKPVIVVQKDALIDMIPANILNNLERIVNGEIVDLGEYISKIRLIPFMSLGKENGILLGIKIDELAIETTDKTINSKDVIMGIYNGNLTKNGKYKALLGLELLEEKNNNEIYARV